MKPQPTHVQFSSFRNMLLWPLGTFVIGISLSLLLFLNIQNASIREKEQAFDLKTESAILRAEENLTETLGAVLSLKYFFESSEEVFQDEFQTFSGPLIKRTDIAESLMWIPELVYEKRVSETGNPQPEKLEVLEWNSEGNYQKSGRKASYFPISFIEGKNGAPFPIGLDLSSNLKIYSGMVLAKKTRQSATSLPFNLPNKSNESFVLLISPVYPEGNLTKPLMGFVGALVSRAKLVKSQMGILVKNSFQISLKEKNGNKFYTYRSTSSNWLGEASRQGTSTNEMPIHLPGRNWSLEVKGVLLNKFLPQRNYSVEILLMGVIGTCLMAIYLLILHQKSQKIISIAQDRTAELRETNQNLFEEMAHHRLVRKALEESSAWLGAVLSSAYGVSIIATDTKGKILVFNAGAEQMLGYTASEMVGRCTPMEFHLKDEVIAVGKEQKPGGVPEDELFTVFTNDALTGAPPREWTYVRKDGDKITVVLSLTAIRDSQKELVGFLGVAQDITERKRIDRMKNEFISIVSHELRTPLTSTVGALGLLDEGIFGELSKDAKEMVGIARQNSERLVRLVNNMLDIEKIESGQSSLTLKKTTLKSLVDRAKSQISPLACNAGIQFYGEIDDAVFMADIDKIDQVFTNLLSNALKYSKENSRIGIQGQLVGSQVVVSIIDHGEGVPEEFRPQLFGKFQQADTSSSRKKQGSGLGLAICKNIIEAHGGKIRFDPTEGGGATFTFTLPLASQE